MGRDGLPKNEAADFENLPEVDFNHYDAMTPAALLKEAKAAKLDPKKMLRHELIEALLEKANPESLYAKGVLETIQDFGFLRGITTSPALATPSSRAPRSRSSTCGPATPCSALYAHRRRGRSSPGCSASRA